MTDQDSFSNIFYYQKDIYKSGIVFFFFFIN